MSYYTVIIPPIGDCYIEECEKFASLKYPGFRDSIGILPINQNKEYSLCVFAYNKNKKYTSSNSMLNYDFYNNRTVYLNIYALNNNLFYGLDFEEANSIVQVLNKTNKNKKS